MRAHVTCMWRSENSFQESFFSFHHVYLGTSNSGHESWCKHPYSLSHLGALPQISCTPVCGGDGTPSMRDALCSPGSWKAAGLWTPGLGLGSFSTRVIFVWEQKAEGDGLTGAESWAGLLWWGSIPQGQLTPNQWWAVWQVFTGPVMKLLSNMEVTTWISCQVQPPILSKPIKETN